MKKNIIQISFILCVMGFLQGCHKHDDFLSPNFEKVSVEFDSVQNDDKQVIQLSFNKPATQSGQLTLSLSNAAPSRFTIEPALTHGEIIVDISKDQQSATVNIKPINNSLPDGNCNVI